MSCVARKLSSGFPTMSDSQAVQPQKKARGLRKKRDCTIYVAKTKALISCRVAAQLSAPLFSHMQKAGFLAS